MYDRPTLPVSLSENSLLRYVSVDKAPSEEHLTGRSSKQSKRKGDRGGSPSHYSQLPSLQMEMLRQESLSTPSSESNSLYHVSVQPSKHGTSFVYLL